MNEHQQSKCLFYNTYCFMSLLAASRAQQGEVMRLACRLDPKTSFQMAGEWLKYQLSTSVDTGSMNCKFFLYPNISELSYQNCS